MAIDDILDDFTVRKAIEQFMFDLILMPKLYIVFVFLQLSFIIQTDGRKCILTV